MRKIITPGDTTSHDARTKYVVALVRRFLPRRRRREDAEAEI
jgi:hypothetical protein